MAGIVCAVRGGPDSSITITRSIELSLETKLPLFFLYVVNLDFLSRTVISRTHAITQEMQKMGEFILLSAETRAAAQGVNAKGEIRHGNVGEEIAAFCREIQADYLVMGEPKRQEQENIFDPHALEEFRERIEAQTGARVVMAGTAATGGEGEPGGESE